MLHKICALEIAGKELTVAAPFEAGAIGKVVITVFKSQDNEDRGELIFHITLDNQK